MPGVFFGGWAGLGRTILVGVPAYLTLIVFLRISGKRTLSKMNAFDLIVTIALGSTLATVMLSKEVALVEGGMVFAVLIGLQFLATWLSVRSDSFRHLITGDPQLLLYRGKPLGWALRRARVTRDELLATIRAAGIGHLTEVEAVVLETDGSFTVVKRNDGSGSSSLADVQGWQPADGV